MRNNYSSMIHVWVFYSDNNWWLIIDYYSGTVVSTDSFQSWAHCEVMIFYPKKMRFDIWSGTKNDELVVWKYKTIHGGHERFFKSN